MTQPQQHRENLEGLRRLAERDQPTGQPTPPPMDDARRRQLNSLRNRADDYAAQLWLMRGPTLGRRSELNSERARVLRLLGEIKRELGE